MPATPETWLADFQVNTTDTGTQTHPDIVQLDTGYLVAVWTDYTTSGPGAPAGQDILAQVISPTGEPVGSEFRVNIAWNVDNERLPSIAALPGGRFVVVFEDDDGNPSNKAIRAEIWQTNLQTGVATHEASATVATSPDASDIVSQPAVAGDSSGGFMVVYQHRDFSEDDHDLRGVYFTYDEVNDSYVPGAPQVWIAGSEASSTEIDIATLTDDRFAAIFEFESTNGDEAQAYAVRDATGAGLAGFVPGTQANGEDERYGSVTGLANGGFVVAWESRDAVSESDVMFQVFDGNGVPQGAAGSLGDEGATDVNRDPSVFGLSGGRFVIAYQDAEGAVDTGLFQQFSATGTPIGTLASFYSADFNYNQTGIGLGDGRFAITWSEDAGIGGAGPDIRVGFYDPRNAINNAAYDPNPTQIGVIGSEDITAGPGSTRVYAWDGDDTVTANTLPDVLYDAGPGDDMVIVQTGIVGNTYRGGDGIDTIDWSNSPGSTGYYELHLSGWAFDYADGGGFEADAMDGFENLIGSPGDDSIIGSPDANDLRGGFGNDTISGTGGDDILVGGWGNDIVLGGDGDDLVRGSNGIDSLEGNAGNDTLGGGNGRDTGLGGEGNDSINMGNNPDLVEGGTGNDTLLGGNGSDTILGQDGDDDIRGGRGDEEIDGGAGFDTLNGGRNDDVLTGGADADTFLFAGAFGNDTVTDFDVFDLNERIDLSYVAAITDFADLSANHMSQVGQNVVIDDLAGNTVTLEFVAQASLSPSYFIF